MRSRLLILGFVAFVAIFAVALWWFQTRAFYDRLPPAAEILVQGQSLAVTDFDGIDGPSSPLKLRACFRVHPAAAPDALSIFPDAPAPTPLVAPGWFDCFDAGALTDALAAGTLRAVTAEANAPYGFDRLIAVDAEGRGWMWRQINPCGRAAFAGDPLPPGCPPPPSEG